MKQLITKVMLLFTVLTAFNMQAYAQQNLPNIYGILRYSEAADFQFGIYTIDHFNAGTPTIYWADPELMGNGGSVYAGDKYYVLSFMDFGGGMLYGSYLICDVDAKTYEYSYPEIDISYVSSDLTYDVTNNKVYACSMDVSGDGSFWLSTMVMETGAKEGIAKMPHMVALAANAEGVLYGIGADGILYTIDKNTAALTEVGPTGILPTNDQSATFDLETGILYWSAYTEQGSGLYTVDITTGEATLMYEYPNGEQLSGLYIKTEKKQGVPASAENMIFDFDKDALSGNVSFTMPTTDTDGNSLTDNLTYSMSIDNGEPLVGNATPGETIKMSVSNLSEGVHMFVVNVKNENGSATPLNIDRYIGMDTPATPIDIIVKSEGENVSLSWTMKEIGANEGYVDMSQIRYRIVRMYDNTTVGTDVEGNTFTDTFEDTNIRICHYEIYPYIGNREGNAAITEDVQVGEYMCVPFEHNLANKGDYLLYTTIDANADKDSWVFDLYPEYSEEEPCATYMWTVTETNDDWLISPYVYLEAGKKYEAKYSIRGEYDAYAGDIEIKLGKEKTVEAMYETIFDAQPVDYNDFTWLTTKTFTVAESGKYVLGLHVCGDRSKYYIYLNGVSVYENETTGIANENIMPIVFVNNDIINVDNISSEQVSIFDAGGVKLLQSMDKNIQVKVEAGLYIVRVGNKVMKLMVK